MMKISTNCLLALACLCFALPAGAQTVRQVFVTAGVSSNMDDIHLDPVAGLTGGLGLSFGVDGARSGVEVSTNLPSGHVQIPPARRYRYVGSSNQYQQQDHFYETSSVERRRPIETSVAFRRRVALNRAVTMAWTVGGGFVHRPFDFSSVTSEVHSDGSLTEVWRIGRRSTRHYVVGVGGLEAALRVAPRLAIVPRLRVTGFPKIADDSGLAPRLVVARPELAVRWTW